MQRRSVKKRSAKEDKLLIQLGLRIKEVRKDKGLTQVHIADALETDYTAIGRIENGRHNPSFIVLNRIARRLDIDISDLLKDL